MREWSVVGRRSRGGPARARDARARLEPLLCLAGGIRASECYGGWSRDAHAGLGWTRARAVRMFLSAPNITQPSAPPHARRARARAIRAQVVAPRRAAIQSLERPRELCVIR